MSVASNYLHRGYMAEASKAMSVRSGLMAMAGISNDNIEEANGQLIGELTLKRMDLLESEAKGKSSDKFLDSFRGLGDLIYVLAQATRCVMLW